MMQYTMDNPPAIGAKVILTSISWNDLNFKRGPFTVASFDGEDLRFSDSGSEWCLYKTIERSGCRDATPEELESTN